MTETFKTMKPLRIEFVMASPILLEDRPVHLDGLLTWCALEAENAKFTSGLRESPPNPYDLNDPLYGTLPLAKEHGVYCASLILPDPDSGGTQAFSTRYFCQSNDDTWVARLGGLGENSPVKGCHRISIIDGGGGSFKKSFVRARLSVISKMVAFCIGDEEAIRELLGEVSAIGKFRSRGYGRVSQIFIAEDDQAKEAWTVRAMPHRIHDHVPCLSALRAPYWHQNLTQIAYLPALF